MSGTGQGSVDVQKLLSLDANALGKKCGCGCGGHPGDGCCCGHHAEGPPWAGPSDEAVKARLKYLAPLIRAARELLSISQDALAEGATTAAEIRDMQRLEIWLGRLLVEEDRYRPRKKGK